MNVNTKDRFGSNFAFAFERTNLRQYSAGSVRVTHFKSISIVIIEKLSPLCIYIVSLI